MSIIRVDTNVPTSDIQEAFFEESIESLAKTFQKPKSEILMFINSDDPIIIGGSLEPAALVSILSVDGINEVNNKLHSAALFSSMTKHLKINEDRIFISFNAVGKDYMGSNGHTFNQ